MPTCANCNSETSSAKCEACGSVRRLVEDTPAAGIGRPRIRSDRLTGRSITLPPDAWRELERMAKEEEISVSALIRRRLGV